MRNQLDKHLLPTIDMKKAIERNAKHEGDLSLALKKIDIEKRLALEQLSRKQEAVKIQMFRKRETLSKQFKVQLFEQGSLESISRPRPNVGLQKSPVRRSWSYEGTSHSSKPHPLELRKRLSLPSSAFCNSTSDDYVKPEREANVQRMEHIPSDSKNDHNSEMSSDKFCKKSEISIRRHSCAHPQENSDSKLLQRRRVTMHNLMMQRSIENEIQTLIRL